MIVDLLNDTVTFASVYTHSEVGPRLQDRRFGGRAVAVIVQNTQFDAREVLP